MRNLEDYQADYAVLPFEATQVQYRRRKVDEVVASYHAKRLLEVGCGTDAYFKHCASFERFTVIEPGELFYAQAKRDASHYDNVEVVLGTVQDKAEALKQQAYDLILLTSLLHEIPDSLGLLQAITHLCDSDTVVHINVPNAKSFHRLLAVEMGLIESPYLKSATQQTMQQSHTFDLASLTALVHEAGFKVLESGSFFIKPFTHAQMADLQGNGLLTPQILDGLYNMSQHLPENGSELYMNIQLESGV